MKPTRSTSNPSARRFDFVALEKKLERAVRRAFRDLTKAHPKETPCAFALYSDDGAMTVCPAFDLASERDARVEAHPDDAEGYTFSTPEWALEGFGADDEFEKLCTLVRSRVLSIEESAQPFGAFKAELFETCVRTLERLRADGFFDPYPDLLVMFAVSDGNPTAKDERRMMKRLNGDSPWVARHRRWTKSWGRR